MTVKCLLNFIGVEVKFKHCTYAVLINPMQVKEMREIVRMEDSVRIGASVTLMEMEEALRKEINVGPGKKKKINR